MQALPSSSPASLAVRFMSPWQMHRESPCRAKIPAVVAAVAAAAPWPQQGAGAAGGLGAARGGRRGMVRAARCALVPRLRVAPYEREVG